MNFLDSVLPIYVDYLGRYEFAGGELETAADVMRTLLERGVTDRRNFLPNGELSAQGPELVLRDNVRQTVFKRFNFRDLHDPTAFISRDQQNGPGGGRKSGFTRVVVVREDSAGHYRGSSVFHAFQCLDNNPDDLVQMIEDGGQPAAPPSVAAASAAPYNRNNSLDNNWFAADNGPARRDSSLVNGITPAERAVTRHLLDPGARRLYETTDDYVEKFTILLNFCIEDIEQFCAEVREIKQNERPGVQLKDITATQFTQMFQKFKLSFNLLAFLQGHIHNPDAEEMLHHLFPPLAFLVDVSFEEFGDELVKDVVAPLPTRKCVRMLSDCLNSREQVIWKALGDYWRQPRENWEGTIPVYRPVFHGWCPGVIRFPDEEDFDQLARVGSDRSKKTSSVSSLDDVFRSSGPARGHDAFRDDLMSRNARIALVTHDWQRQNPRELTINKGEYLQVLDDERKWWRCRNEDGEVGFVPSTMVKAIIYQDQFDNNDRDYRDRRTKKKEVERPPSPTPSIPPPAPPMPVVLPEVIKDRRHETYPKTEEIRPRKRTDTMRSDDPMQKELASVLAVYREQAKERLHIKKTPEMFITQQSTPTEVRNWLLAKQFSRRVMEQTAGMHGGQLMGMSRKDLVEVFGKEEGRRLYSQITISRNSTNYKTVRSSELQEVLKKARTRTETSVSSDHYENYDEDNEMDI